MYEIEKGIEIPSAAPLRAAYVYGGYRDDQ